MRWEVWKGCYDGGEWVGDGWVDMERMLFGRRGVKKLREFGKKIGWKDMVWGWGRWKGEELRKGREVVERLRGCGGMRLERSEEEKEALRKWDRERMRKRRGILAQATTTNAIVVTGAKRLTREMVKDGWEKVKGGRIVKKGVRGGVREGRSVLGELSGNGRREGDKGKGVRR